MAKIHLNRFPGNLLHLRSEIRGETVNIKNFKYLLLIIIAVSCSGRLDKESSLQDLQKITKADNNQLSSPVIEFSKTIHDFDKVYQGEKLEYTFTFANVGKSDLIIFSASASCGCTVPEYDKKPVPPGKEGKITVLFDTKGFRGAQSKSITITSNASNSIIVLFITANIIV